MISEQGALDWRQVRERLVTWTGRKIHNLGLRDADPEDFVHSALLIVLTKRRRGRLPDEAVESFLRRVILHKLLDYQRRRSCEIRSRQKVYEKLIGHVRQRNVDDELDRSLVVRRMLEEVLDEQTRAIIILYVMEDLTSTEVARRLGLSGSAVRDRWMQIRSSLRARFAVLGTEATHM